MNHFKHIKVDLKNSLRTTTPSDPKAFPHSLAVLKLE